MTLGFQRLGMARIIVNRRSRPRGPHFFVAARGFHGLAYVVIYLVAAVGFSLTPGPNSLLALTHCARHRCNSSPMRTRRFRAAVSCFARMAHRIRPKLERHGKRFNRVCGGAFAAMGVALPMTR